MEKKEQVHMLPTDKSSNLCKVSYYGPLIGEKGKLMCAPNRDAYTNDKNDSVIIQPHHLYFTTDEKIKEGDWVVHNGVPKQATDESVIKFANNLKLPKIVATTNPELWYFDISNLGCGPGKAINIPKIGLDFVEAYVKAYNEGNPIKEVMLEYKEAGYWMNLESLVESRKPKWIYTHDEIKLRNNGTVIWNIITRNYREEAMVWWNGLTNNAKQLFYNGYAQYTPATSYAELTGREIQNIWAVQNNPPTEHEVKERLYTKDEVLNTVRQVVYNFTDPPEVNDVLKCFEDKLPK